MSEQNKTDKKTLLELSAFYEEAERVEADYRGQDADKAYALEALRNLAQINPVQAIGMALIMEKHIPHSDWMERIISPYADQIPDDDIDTLRLATASIAGWVVDIGTNMVVEQELIQSLAQCLQKLSRTRGHEGEVRALADYVFQKCWAACTEDDEKEYFQEQFVSIAPFTTVGKMTLQAGNLAELKQ